MMKNYDAIQSSNFKLEFGNKVASNERDCQYYLVKL